MMLWWHQWTTAESTNRFIIDGILKMTQKATVSLKNIAKMSSFRVFVCVCVFDSRQMSVIAEFINRFITEEMLTTTQNSNWVVSFKNIEPQDCWSELIQFRLIRSKHRQNKYASWDLFHAVFGSALLGNLGSFLNVSRNRPASSVIDEWSEEPDLSVWPFCRTVLWKEANVAYHHHCVNRWMTVVFGALGSPWGLTKRYTSSVLLKFLDFTIRACVWNDSQTLPHRILAQYL